MEHIIDITNERSANAMWKYIDDCIDACVSREAKLLRVHGIFINEDDAGNLLDIFFIWICRYYNPKEVYHYLLYKDNEMHRSWLYENHDQNYKNRALLWYNFSLAHVQLQQIVAYWAHFRRRRHNSLPVPPHSRNLNIISRLPRVAIGELAQQLVKPFPEIEEN